METINQNTTLNIFEGADIVLDEVELPSNNDSIITNRIGKLSPDRLSNIQSLLNNIRIKPETLCDLQMINRLDDREVKLCENMHCGEYKVSSTYYGNTNKSITKINESIINYDIGETYGQDYIMATDKYISLMDGHGSDGERYACYAGVYLPKNIDITAINTLLIEGEFDKIFTLVEEAFNKVTCSLKLYNAIPSCGNYNNYNNIDDIITECGIQVSGGTTANYTSIQCVEDSDGFKKRFIVSANLGDSETYAVFRYPCGKCKIHVLSYVHSVENIEEAQKIIDDNRGDILKVLPIYSRFNSHDVYGNNRGPLPEPVIPHLDHMCGTSTIPIYKFNKAQKLEVNLETLHKMNMGLGSYGEAYQIYDWFGGIQGLRTNVIQKKIGLSWVSVGPLPDGNPGNYGSTPNGCGQSTRGFGDTHYDYISSKPNINIIEIPKDVHVTIISQSDGYGDIIHLSDVAHCVEKVPYGTFDAAVIIKANMIKLLYDSVIGKEVRGFSINNYLQPTWDDVSFGIIDSPPLEKV